MLLPGDVGMNVAADKRHAAWHGLPVHHDAVLDLDAGVAGERHRAAVAKPKCHSTVRLRRHRIVKFERGSLLSGERRAAASDLRAAADLRNRADAVIGPHRRARAEHTEHCGHRYECD